jgi:hypothetical protein
LFVAIFTRVLQYGYTEARYFVLLISLWLTILVLYFVFFKKATIKFIPISLFIFGLFALIFPYLNVFSVSIRSQENELIEVLKENNLLVNNKINFGKQVTDSIANSVENKLEFLSERFDDEFIEVYLDAETVKKSKTNKYWYTNIFLNITHNQNQKNNNYFLRISSNKKIINIKDYQFVINNNQYDGNIETELNNDKISITENYGSSSFEIKINEKSKDILPILKTKFFNKYKNASDDVFVDDLSIEVIVDKYKVKVVFGSIDWNKDLNSFNYGNIIYLIKTN